MKTYAADNHWKKRFPKIEGAIHGPAPTPKKSILIFLGHFNFVELFFQQLSSLLKRTKGVAPLQTLLYDKYMPPKTTTKSSLALALALAFTLAACTNSPGTNSSVLASNIGNATPSPTSTAATKQLNISSVNVIAPTTSNSNTTTSTSASPTPSSSSSPSLTPPTLDVFFNTTTAPFPISQVCSASSSNSGSSSSTSTNACSCLFTWYELNQNSGTSSPILRSVTTTVTAVQPFAVVCPGPAVYYSDIPSGTQVNLTVQPAAGNTNSFSVPTFSFTTNSTATTSTFQDVQGNLYDDIFHYSCYNLLQKGLTVQSKTTVQTNQTTGATANVYMASQVCLATNAGGASASGTNCPNLPAIANSAQSYYYNFFIRSSEVGNIVQANGTFLCPTVQESLYSTNTVGTTNQYWPLDATFALSLSPSSVFNVAVEANTQLVGAGDSVNTSNSCYPGGTPSPNPVASAASGGGASVVTSCLGFAATPNTDGTCPSTTDTSGTIHQTYRLRRYIAVYPRFFDTDGKAIQNIPQPTDTIYVLDRPVQAPANADATKSFTMRGPKPCPFAYFDNKGVTDIAPIPSPTAPATCAALTDFGYVGSSNCNWAGKNIDGIEFPNIDTIGSPGNSSTSTTTTSSGTTITTITSSTSINALGQYGQAIAPSCAMALPVLNSSQTKFTLHTLSFLNIAGNTAFPNSNTTYQHAYVRPSQPFFPHYQEDTGFKACAPQAKNFKDAPLHFARQYLPVPVGESGETTKPGNVAWCAEYYPTQNPNISQIDPFSTGRIKSYTSHVVKSSGSASCVATVPTGIPSPYPSLVGIPTPFPTPTATVTTVPNSYALHPNTLTWDAGNASETCDRTVSPQSTAQWYSYPLLAPASDIENAIALDSSYFCAMTYDQNGGKTISATAGNTVAQGTLVTPSSGCCSSSAVSLSSGPTVTATSTPTGAHLEPDVPCGIPQY